MIVVFENNIEVYFKISKALAYTDTQSNFEQYFHVQVIFPWDPTQATRVDTDVHQCAARTNGHNTHTRLVPAAGIIQHGPIQYHTDVERRTVTTREKKVDFASCCL